MKDASHKMLGLGLEIGLKSELLDTIKHYEERHKHLSLLNDKGKSKFNLLNDRTKLWNKYFKMNLQLFAAQTLYVKTGGNDSLTRAQNTSSTPWAHCPGMAGWTGSAVLEAGDIVTFDNASTFSTSSSYELNTTADGVEYDGTTWGTGTRAILQCTASHNALSVIKHNNITYVGIDFDASNQDGYGVMVNGYDATKAISNIEINNCIVRRMGATNTWMYGILINNNNNNAYSVTDCRIINCFIYDVNHEGIAIYPGQTSTPGAVNILVRGCTVYNTGRSSTSFGEGVLLKGNVNGATIEFCNLYDNDCGVMFAENGMVYSPINVKVRYNLIRSNRASGIYFLGAGSSQAYTADIYGNIFITNADSHSGGDYGADILFEPQTQTNTVVNIFNNTFYSVGMTATQHHCLWIACSGTPTITVKNNIFYTDDHPCITDTGNKIGSNHSNNQFWRTSGSGGVVVDSTSDYTRTNVTTWEATAKSSDPEFTGGTLPTGFVGVYGTSMVPNTNYFAIPAGKPAIDTGATLGSPYNGAINLSGISGGLTRPQGSAYDIGAYEYGTEEESSNLVSVKRIFLI